MLFEQLPPCYNLGILKLKSTCLIVFFFNLKYFQTISKKKIEKN